MTHNIEGHNRSEDTCQKLISKFKPDFFLRQEDWLFGFQHYKLSQLNSNYVGVGMSVDCDNPILLSRNEKAKWGLDILFTNEMNSLVSPLPEHSNQRIQTVKISLEIPIILINVYLPASSLPQQVYDDSLNLLASVIANFQTEAAIFVAGDCNRSLFRNNPGDLKFQKFCKIIGLQPAANTKQVPTYHGYNGSTSQIDYILMHKESCMMFGIKEDDLKIIKQVCKDDDPTILSTHDAIYFELNISVSPSTSEISVVQSTQVNNKIHLWNSADLELYQHSLENILTKNFEFWNKPECISIIARLIPQAFIQSAEIAVPAKPKKEINFKTIKSEEWRKAEIAAKKTTKKWKTQGSQEMKKTVIFWQKRKLDST